MKRASIILGLIVLLGGGAFLAQRGSFPVKPRALPPATEPGVTATPVPAFSASAFLNTASDTRYVGTAACAGCHPNNHKSYALTAHSQALADIDPANEPPDGTYEHKLSGRTYRVYRKDGQLRHEEVLRTAEGKEIARVDLPMRYRVGSGHFTRTYVVEIEGFLHESPVTWYASKQKWDMSPGCDRPRHWSFERPVQLGCVLCHAGRAEPDGASEHRLTLHEKAVGCESCHGPGARHLEFHKSQKPNPGASDSTIVHPGKLSRPLLESVCAACHLNSPAPVLVRGRELANFRPGLPLSDFLIHYNFASAEEGMTVVGHVEQLRQSACYQKAPELTCVTCHDPHARTRPADAVAFYRQKCLTCHDTRPCSEPAERRLKKSPADNCAACHMPRGETDIPHLAFTHHRIGRHKTLPKPVPPLGVPDLVPLDDNPNLGELDRKRNLGLAYMAVARNPLPGWPAKAYWERARPSLATAYRGGVSDAETVYALAEIASLEGDPPRAARLARETLSAPGLHPRTRASALQLLATFESEYRHDAPAAAALMEQVVRVRRFADDWRLLGTIYLDQNKPEQALPAFEQALAIRPYRAATHMGLSECYRRLGDPVRQNEHRDTAEWLRQHQQD